MCNINRVAAGILAVSFLFGAGCKATGNEYAANVYGTNQVNQKQEAKTVKIIAVMEAKIAVDNTENKKNAQTFGTVLGAAAGTMVDDKVLVDGVTLTYSEDDKIYTSSQLGRQCQFQPGVALIVSTKANETRIQPNAVCPAGS